MVAKWVALIILTGFTAGTVDARQPSPAKARTAQVRIAEQWKSPVAADTAHDAARNRWLLQDDIPQYSEDNSGFRWRLHGAKVKMRMPFALHLD
ncbi:hypothetical protein ACFB49_38810 [Sphingomonas sp. DBB INV C78]|uniref:hypothetical protein n=1 Tax=Sphingomonas sp. DBB INV C78 TaxID=3349434 RepID=UPI0036D230BB